MKNSILAAATEWRKIWDKTFGLHYREGAMNARKTETLRSRSQIIDHSLDTLLHARDIPIK